jgi:hypothetical protein
MRTTGSNFVLMVAMVVLVTVDCLTLSTWLLGQGLGSRTLPGPTQIGTAYAGTTPIPVIPSPMPPARTPAYKPPTQSRLGATQGSAMPVGNITDTNGTWREIFAENFNTPVPVGSFPGTVYGSRWKVYLDGWKDTTGNGTYYPSRVLSVSNGVLNMHLHTEIVNGVAVHMVAAPEPKLPSGAGQTYGRYSVRFKVDPVPGYKTAWLLWPDTGVWPRDGEVDYPDCNLTGTVHAFMHYASSSGGQTAFSTNVPEAGAWHIATMEWQPGKVTFVLDGTLIGVATTRVPSTPMHYVLQTETQLSGGPPSNTAAGNVKVDWVAIYSRA